MRIEGVMQFLAPQNFYDPTPTEDLAVLVILTIFLLLTSLFIFTL